MTFWTSPATVFRAARRRRNRGTWARAKVPFLGLPPQPFERSRWHTWGVMDDRHNDLRQEACRGSKRAHHDVIGRRSNRGFPRPFRRHFGRGAERPSGRPIRGSKTREQPRVGGRSTGAWDVAPRRRHRRRSGRPPRPCFVQKDVDRLTHLGWAVCVLLGPQPQPLPAVALAGLRGVTHDHHNGLRQRAGRGSRRAHHDVIGRRSNRGFRDRSDGTSGEDQSVHPDVQSGGVKPGSNRGLAAGVQGPGTPLRGIAAGDILDALSDRLSCRKTATRPGHLGMGEGTVSRPPATAVRAVALAHFGASRTTVTMASAKELAGGSKRAHHDVIGRRRNRGFRDRSDDTLGEEQSVHPGVQSGRVKLRSNPGRKRLRDDGFRGSKRPFQGTQ